MFLLNITIQVGEGHWGEGACEPARTGGHLWRKRQGAKCFEVELHDRTGQGL